MCGLEGQIENMIRAGVDPCLFKPAGKQVAMSVDDSVPHKESPSDSSWSYLSDWDMFINITYGTYL